MALAPVLLAHAAGVLPADPAVLRATLPNGLRVVLVRNALAPVVSTSMNYLVGSNQAPAGFPGMAHAQEHMMFRGSVGLSGDQLANLSSLMGGSFNANTRENLTQYLYTVPAEDLEVALHIEALRMQATLDSPADWAQERGAIEQEVASDMSNPEWLLEDKLREVLFKGTPYEHDALGTRPSFDRTTTRMLQSFYDRWYVPNNAILVVVGDIDPPVALERVRVLFGAIHSKVLPRPPAFHFSKPPRTPLALTTDNPTGMQLLAFRVPGFESADFPALEVLTDVISSHRFELYNLTTEGRALDTGFALIPYAKASIAFTVAAFPKGANPRELESGMRKVLRHLARSGVLPDMIAAAKRQEHLQAEAQKTSIAGLASIWADSVALYGLSSPEEDLARIDRVTLADVNRVARRYFNQALATPVLVTPQESEHAGAPTARFGGGEQLSIGDVHATALPAWAQVALTGLAIKPSGVAPVVSTLANGLTLIVQREAVSDSVSIYGHIRTREEIQGPVEKLGVAEVLGELFSYGGGGLDRVQLQRSLDESGIAAHAGTDFSAEALSEDFERAAEILAWNELDPLLPAQAFATITAQLAPVRAAERENPIYVGHRRLYSALLPGSDPELRESTEQSVRALTLQDVRDYYRTVVRPDMATMVVIGNIDPARARTVIEKYFGRWAAVGPAPQLNLPEVPLNKPALIAIPDSSRVQDVVTLGQTIPLGRADPDYYALELGSAVLGGGFYSTRLSIELRKRLGLVYSVGSTLQAGATRSEYFIDYACDPENVSRAEHIAVQELKTLQRTPVGAAELEQTKALLIRRMALAESSIDQIAQGLIARQDAHLALDEPAQAAARYLALTPLDVQAAFQKWIRPDDLVRVARGPKPQ